MTALSPDLPAPHDKSPPPERRDPAWRGRLAGAAVALFLLWPMLVLTEFKPWLLLQPDSLRVSAHFLASFWPLAHEPDFLLLDEAFSALDVGLSREMQQLVRLDAQERDMTVVLVTHDLSEAISLADRVIVLSNRPATIKQTIPLLFHLEHDTPLNRRSAPEFKNYFDLIWKELNRNE